MSPIRNGQIHIHIPWQFRWLFVALAVVTAWVAFQTHIWNPVSIGVFALSILGFLYDERWVFDRESGEVLYRIGILFFGHHFSLGMREIDHFEFCVVHRKGKPLCQLIMWTVAQEPFLIESQGIAYREMFIYEARQLADFCGKALTGADD